MGDSTSAQWDGRGFGTGGGEHDEGRFPVGVAMVRCGSALLRKYGNFIDNLRLYVRGGSGGMGFRRLGGEGGDGGNVLVISEKGVTLKMIKDKYPNKRFVAGVGANSSVQSLKGAKGKDCAIYAPIGISITGDNGKIIGDLNQKGDKLLVAQGGRGGSFKTNFLPSKGQAGIIRLDLKLVADVGLVGFPNAGKSTLLSQLSHAKPKIGDYPFTTLRPEIGTLLYSDYKQVSVADLPGLIEGAHLNKGMGHKFLKHVERTKQLLYVVDVTGFQLSSKTSFRTAFEAIQFLTKELELYKPELLSKPALLAVSKMDLENAEEKFKELMQQLQQPQDFSHATPEERIPMRPFQFEHIIPVSAVTGNGIKELKNCIRKSLDDQNDLENEYYRLEKLQSLHSNTC